MVKRLYFVLLLVLASIATNPTWAKELPVLEKFAEDDLYRPSQLICSDKKIYVLDRGDESVKVFSEEKTLKNKIGGKGEGPGQFHFACYLAIDDDKFYVLDTGKWAIHFFDKKTKRFLHFKRYKLLFDGYSPNTFRVTNSKQFLFATTVSIKGQKVITKLDEKLKPEFAFLDCYKPFKSESDFSAKLKKIKGLPISIFYNLGYLAELDKNIYYVYQILNKVMVFSPEGKKLKEYTLPIPSMEHTAKVKHFSDGSADLDGWLNYDIKSRNGAIYVLSRNNKNQSVLFQLKNEKFVEVCRMKEPLMGFDIMGNRLYGLHDGEEGVFVYDWKNDSINP